MHWTASINVFEHEDSLSYSIRMWRVAEQGRVHKRPDRTFSGRVTTPSAADPAIWLQALLEALQAAL